MKLFTLLFLPLFSVAQQKHDNTIMIKGVSLKQVLNAFMDAGYSIDKYDTSMGFAYTAPQREGACTAIYIARIKDSVLIMSGKMRLDVKLFPNINNTDDFWPMEYRGTKNSDFMLTWGHLDKMAKSFGFPVTYEKR